MPSSRAKLIEDLKAQFEIYDQERFDIGAGTPTSVFLAKIFPSHLITAMALVPQDDHDFWADCVSEYSIARVLLPVVLGTSWPTRDLTHGPHIEGLAALFAPVKDAYLGALARAFSMGASTGQCNALIYAHISAMVNNKCAISDSPQDVAARTLITMASLLSTPKSLCREMAWGLDMYTDAILRYAPVLSDASTVQTALKQVSSQRQSIYQSSAQNSREKISALTMLIQNTHLSTEAKTYLRDEYALATIDPLANVPAIGDPELLRIYDPVSAIPLSPTLFGSVSDICADPSRTPHSTQALATISRILPLEQRRNLIIALSAAIYPSSLQALQFALDDMPLGSLSTVLPRILATDPRRALKCLPHLAPAISESDWPLIANFCKSIDPATAAKYILAFTELAQPPVRALIPSTMIASAFMDPHLRARAMKILPSMANASIRL